MQDLKVATCNAEPLQHVGYDAKLRVLQHALGTYTRRTQVQGSRLKMRREIRVATLSSRRPRPRCCA